MVSLLACGRPRRWRQHACRPNRCNPGGTEKAARRAARAYCKGNRTQKSRACRCRLRPLGIGACPTHNSSMYKLLHYERADYSVVVKNMAPPPRAWRWEIYRAGNAHPIKQSSIYFDTIVSAKRAGKVALTELLNKLFA